MDQTDSPRPKTTFTPRKLSRPNSFGFTLIEVLIVMAIIGLVLAMGLPAVNQIVSQRLGATARRFVGVSRTLRNDAILLNQIHRIAINFEDQTWWVELQQKFSPLEVTESGALNTGGFSKAEKFTTKALALPGGVAFAGLLRPGGKVQDSGVGYVHFFPNGYADPSFIFLARKSTLDSGFLIAIPPTGTQVEVTPEDLEGFQRLAAQR